MMYDKLFKGVNLYQVQTRTPINESLLGRYFFVPGHDETLPKVINANHSLIQNILSDGILVNIGNTLTQLTPKDVEYLAPCLSDVSIPTSSDVDNYLLDFFQEKRVISPFGMFVCFPLHEVDDHITILELTTNDGFEYFEGLKEASAYLIQVHAEYKQSKGQTLYSAVDFDDFINDGDADYQFDEEAKILSNEILERVKKLRLKGIDDGFIRAIFDKGRKISSLLITEDYRILLPEFQGMEINMEPLPKAVFLLFLRHPEGIYFKQLQRYSHELYQIYRALTKSEDISDVYPRLERITDPYDNSINEKCSRIREAFVSKMSEDIAENYIITGRRGCEKKIKLDRNLIKIQCEF